MIQTAIPIGVRYHSRKDLLKGIDKGDKFIVGSQDTPVELRNYPGLYLIRYAVTRNTTVKI